MWLRGGRWWFSLFLKAKKKKKVLWSEQRGDMGNENYLFG